MADKSKIEWTDATWNPIAGCTKISPGCKNCYPIKDAHRMSSNPNLKIQLKYKGTVTEDGKNWTGQINFSEDSLLIPLHWKKPRRIFVNSVSDLFHQEVKDEWIDKIFNVMYKAKHHTFQILTKRPERMFDYVSRSAFLSNAPFPNVLLGTSVEDQEWADKRRDFLRQISDAQWTTFVSYEPALGMVDWSGWEFLDWIISGGESGNGARPSHPDYHRAARDFCQANGIAYLFKQWGNWLPCSQAIGNEQILTVGGLAQQPKEDRIHAWGNGTHSVFMNKHAAGRLLDGVEYNEMPERIKGFRFE